MFPYKNNVKSFWTHRQARNTVGMLLIGFRFITIRYWVTLSTLLHHVCYDTHASMCLDNFGLLYWFMDPLISFHSREVSYLDRRIPKRNAAWYQCWHWYVWYNRMETYQIDFQAVSNNFQICFLRRSRACSSIALAISYKLSSFM